MFYVSWLALDRFMNTISQRFKAQISLSLALTIWEFTKSGEPTRLDLLCVIFDPLVLGHPESCHLAQDLVVCVFLGSHV